MDEKLIRDTLGSPVPQHFNEELGMFTVNTLDGSTVTNGDIDFSRTKLLRDQLGSVIPQIWDALNNKWVVATTQNAGGDSGGIPTSHTHEISEVNGLKERLDEVFTQVSSGKLLLETAIAAKGSAVNKTGDVATFEELNDGILGVEGSNTTPQKYFSDDYPLPTNDIEFQNKKGYAIIQYPNEIRLYAINDYLGYNEAEWVYSTILVGWSKWHLIGGTWNYIESSAGALGGSNTKLEKFIELSHHSKRNNEITFEGRLGHFEWYKNI